MQGLSLSYVSIGPSPSAFGNISFILKILFFLSFFLLFNKTTEKDEKMQNVLGNSERKQAWQNHKHTSQ